MLSAGQSVKQYLVEAVKEARMHPSSQGTLAGAPGEPPGPNQANKRRKIAFNDPTTAFTVTSHVRSMNRTGLLQALRILGFTTADSSLESDLRSKLLDLLCDTCCQDWEATLEAAVERCVTKFLEQFLTETSAEKKAQVLLQRFQLDRPAMWQQLVAEHCPPAPSAPDRSGKRVLAIGPGFGFLANPEQIRIVERAGYTVNRLLVRNPQEQGFQMDNEVGELLTAIESFQPDAILCASKGGAYMVRLWELMEQNQLPKIPCLMINVHPSVAALPKDVKIVLVQGSEEEVWPRARGYNARGEAEDGSLEHLIRTGSPGLCYLYYTVDKGGMRRRRGDKHNPASLLKYDCLPRLIDSLVLSDVYGDFPAFAFPITSGVFTSFERRQHETTLGCDPRSLRKFWVSKDKKGLDDQQRFDVDPASEEFTAVAGIFKSEPSVERFYASGVMAASMSVERIERLENGFQHESMDSSYDIVQKRLKLHGSKYVNGVHARWLFHGAGSAEIVEEIVGDPSVGFKPWFNQRGLWGKGVYFARDVAYSIECPGCCNTCLDDDGNMMVLLCLVQTGLPCVGEEHMTENMPKVHEGMRPQKIRYDTFVDCPSNPEIFVMPQGVANAYPAYIIHFS